MRSFKSSEMNRLKNRFSRRIDAISSGAIPNFYPRKLALMGSLSP